MRRRKRDRSQAIHARLEETLRGNWDDPRAARAYADALHARGDPLGELMLLSMRAEEYARQKRYEWQPRDARFYVSSLCRASRRAELLITRHWAEWFGELDARNAHFTWKHGLVREASFGCYAHISDLTRVLRAEPLRFVESIEARELIGHLQGLQLPATVRELAIPVTVALDAPEQVSHLGPGLTLSGSLRELQTWRDELRRCFPGVKLAPRLPVPTIDADYVGPKATREPTWAGEGPTECARTLEDKRPFRFCAACASEDTTLLAALPDPCANRTSVTYEYVCSECGWFTWYAIVDLEPSFPRPAPVRRVRKPRNTLRLAS